MKRQQNKNKITGTEIPETQLTTTTKNSYSTKQKACRRKKPEKTDTANRRQT
jgi:hypothetical protein